MCGGGGFFFFFFVIIKVQVERAGSQLASAVGGSEPRFYGEKG